MLIVRRSTAFACIVLALVAGFIGGAQTAMRRPVSVLIGVGCDGPHLLAVAYEEDRLPACVSIERHTLAR